MTLYVQNDTGTQDDANSYVTVAAFQEYWIARGVDYTTDDDATIEAYLIPATSYLDTRYKYNGYKSNGRSQTTEFPREELYDYSGEDAELVEGVPREIKDAQCEYAHIQAEQGFLQQNGDANGSVKVKKDVIGPIEEYREYSPAGQNGATINYPHADSKIPSDFIVAAGNDGMAVHV